MSITYSASGAVLASYDCGKDDIGPPIKSIETFCTPLIGFVFVTAQDGTIG
jgi:hypothetical protein